MDNKRDSFNGVQQQDVIYELKMKLKQCESHMDKMAKRNLEYINTQAKYKYDLTKAQQTITQRNHQISDLRGQIKGLQNEEDNLHRQINNLGEVIDKQDEYIQFACEHNGERKNGVCLACGKNFNI